MAAQTLVYKGTTSADRFGFEESFDVIAWTDLLRAHRLWVLPISALYVILVFAGRSWMAARPAYRLQGSLLLWNVLLGAFSLIGAWRTVPTLVLALAHNGWHSTVCDSVYYGRDFIGVWGLLFTLSKLPELGDTVFVVLRKKPLLGLHWYHHASVPLFVAAVYSSLGAPGVWFTVMNFTVHGLMYPYYALRAAGIRLPKAVAMAITSLQIIQMFAGNLLVIYAAVSVYTGRGCDIGVPELAVSIVLYFSYLILFARFFSAAYLGRAPAARPAKQPSTAGKTDPGLGGKDPESFAIHLPNGEGIRKRELDRNDNRMNSGI